MALIQPVPDDEIAAEFAEFSASLPEDERELSLARDPHSLDLSADADVSAPGSVGEATDRRRRGDPRDLREAMERVRPSSMAHERTLPLLPALAGLFPAGLVRGATVSVGSGSSANVGPDTASDSIVSGATSLALALTSSASQAGSWVAIVGLPALGLAAAAELGLALERVAVITAPPVESWAPVLAALVGAFDVVLFAPPERVKLTEIRRLAARARERGSVLVHVDTDAGHRDRDPSSSRSVRRVLDADLRLRIVDSRWQGLGVGHGYLRGRQVTVEVDGRRQAARPRRHDLWLLDVEGRVETAVASVADEPIGLSLVAARRERVRRVAAEPLVPSAIGPSVPVADAG